MSTKPQARPNPVEVVFPRGSDGVGYKLGKDVVTEEFEAWKPIDEQMGYDERIRLLYVACTRACDHLVVSLHRAERRDPPKTLSTRTNAELLQCGMGDLLGQLPDVGGRAEPLEVDPAAAPTAPQPFAAWEAERVVSLASASRPGAVAATALTDEGGPDTGLDPTRPTIVAEGSWATVGDVPSLFDVLDDGDPGPTEPTDLLHDDEVDPGLQKRPRDLDLPAVAQGPLRHRRGQRRARRPPDDRPGHRRRDWTRPWRPSARPRPCPTGSTSCAVSSRSPSAPPPCERRPPPTTGARSTPARRSATDSSRATSTSSTATPDGLVVVDHKTADTTERRRSSTGASRATACRAPPTPSR